MHIDDDDWSHPCRVEDQVGRLQSANAQVTGYHSMRFTDGERWWQYRGWPGYALGTSLCYRREWWAAHRFPALQVGEDNQFVMQAEQRRALASADAGDLMWATIHAGNTSPRQMSGENWTLCA